MTINVLGTPLLATTYEDMTQHCQELVRTDRPWAVDFTNTMIVTMRRHHPQFRELTSAMDIFLPDGMPLIWCMNGAGAALTDRVYGPTFMRKFLEHVPATSTHFLLGGSEEVGRQLQARFPRVNVVGRFHGYCSSDGILEGDADQHVREELIRVAPDYVWVGLGTPKQYAWVHRNKHHLRRGLLLAVGFAFDVNAGTKSDAPQWMQRRGLTWVFRIASEPRRLLTRYLRYNTLFLFYLVHDLCSGRSCRR